MADKDRCFDGQGLPHDNPEGKTHRANDGDWQLPTPDPTPAAVREHHLHALYHACLDAFTPAEPRDVTQMSQVSAWMLQWGAPDIGRDIGRSVQRWRNAARATGTERLRQTLLTIESEMK